MLRGIRSTRLYCEPVFGAFAVSVPDRLDGGLHGDTIPHSQIFRLSNGETFGRGIEHGVKLLGFLLGSAKVSP